MVSSTAWIRSISVVVLLLVAGVAFAQTDEQSPYDQPLRLNLGGFFENFDMTASLGSKSGGNGTDVNFEKDLGLGNQATFRVDGYYAFGPHGRLVFGYRGWSRKSTHTLTKDIEWGDQTYPINASVDFQQRAHIVDLYYGYSFVHTPKFDAGLMLGVTGGYHKVSLQVTAAAGAETRQSKSLTVPVPTLGAYFQTALTPRFLVTASVRGLPKITVSDYSASQLEALAGLSYFFTKNVGLGVTYYYENFTVSHNVAQLVSLDFKYNGPAAYLSLSF